MDGTGVVVIVALEPPKELPEDEVVIRMSQREALRLRVETGCTPPIPYPFIAELHDRLKRVV